MPDARRPHATCTIVFDLDGTLVDTAPDLAAAANHALGARRAGAGDARRSCIPFIGHGSRAMIEAGLRLHGVALSEAEVNRLHEAFLALLRGQHRRAAAGRSRASPELLDTLQAAGARLAVCTNKFEGLSKSLLRQLGLDARFGAIAGRDTFDVFKPAPGHLTGTIAMAGGSVERAVMVGDSEVDIATADRRRRALHRRHLRLYAAARARARRRRRDRPLPRVHGGAGESAGEPRTVGPWPPVTLALCPQAIRPR